MPRELVIKNALVVAPDQVIKGSVKIADGLIQAVDEGYVGMNGALDLEGDYLVPGLIELHTDHLEKQLAPRPGVIWPSALAALRAHDAQIIGSGITTVLDAVFVGEEHEAGARRAMLDLSVQAVDQARGLDILRAEHLLHLRCEVAEEATLPLFERYRHSPMVRLVSVMDHTPGQRQFRDPVKYRQYYNKQNWSDADFEKISAELRQKHDEYAEKTRKKIIELCHGMNLPVASHDDTTGEQVDQGKQEGVVISEFPTTAPAARRAQEHGLRTICGAPNLVRGGSHSGNVSVLDLAEEGLVDALSSDYVPGSLMHAAFLLHTKLGQPLSQAMARVSANPAAMLGMEDRGSIAPGLQADLARVRRLNGLPWVDTVWRRGRQVF